MNHVQSYYKTNDGEQLTKITDLAQLKGLPEFFFAIYQSNIKLKFTLWRLFESLTKKIVILDFWYLFDIFQFW